MGRNIPKALKDDVRSRARGRCESCKRKFPPAFMEADHITAVRIGGPTTLENLQLLCRECNAKKGGSALTCGRCGEELRHKAAFCDGCGKRITRAEQEKFGWIPRQGFDVRNFVLKVLALSLLAYGIYLYLQQNR